MDSILIETTTYREEILGLPHANIAVGSTNTI